MVLTVNAKGAGSSFLQLFTADLPTPVIKPGKNMTFFIKIPTGTNWSAVRIGVQDGPAKNSRYTYATYTRDQILPSEWNSVVVRVPTDFAMAYSLVGLQIDSTGPGTIKLYVDSLFFDD
jgi:hypothetical protein